MSEKKISTLKKKEQMEKRLVFLFSKENEKEF